jgi:hypothetical protein
MSIFSRFFGKSDADDSADGQPLVDNSKIERPLSLQVLFAEPAALDPDRLTEALRACHRSMSGIRCEIDTALAREGKVFGMVGWGKHVVRCVGFDLPMPSEAVEACVAPVWMRTYGASLLGLPDLAAHAAGHQEGQRYFDMFNNMFRYLLKSGARFSAGHTMQIADREYLRVRTSSENERFLRSDTELLVVDVIGPDEIKSRMN